MQLVIYAPKEGEFIQEISFNNEEIKQELALRLEKYKGLVYSESSIKEAKTDRASLNKFKDAIETRRKEIKKQCLKPYEDFEAKVKEIVAMIDQPILAIDGQIKAFEQAKKDEKTETIKGFYADSAGDLTELVPYEKVFNPRWLNVTCKEADIKKEITELFAKIETDLKVITELQSEYELQIKDTYLRAFDLTAALQEKKRLEEQAAKLAEHKRQQEEKRQQAQEPKTIIVDGNVGLEEAKPGDRIVFGGEPITAPIEIVVDFRVWATNEQLKALGQYMRANGIKYGKVPTEKEAI
jgi:glucan-binding YG repeat protein